MQNIDFNAEFAQAYDALENSNDHIFLTGPAGSGKSTLLDYFRSHSTKNLVVLAPTGVAALNVKGQTVHSFFRFKPDITPAAAATLRIGRKQRQLYESLETIIIDEVSMVRADLLDSVDVFLRQYGPRFDKPFGGVQMVLVGDLFQLPPVVTDQDKTLFQEHYPSPYFFDSKVFKQIHINRFILEKIYRQTDDEFLDILNSIRNNSITASGFQKLNERFSPRFVPDADDFFICLTPTNWKAEQYNNYFLKRLPEPSFSFEAEASGEMKERLFPAQKKLILKNSAQVMLLNNDSEGRWINGSLGKVIDVNQFDRRHSEIIVQLEDGRTVEVTPFSWEVFKFYFDDETGQVESESVGAFRQYPLKLAWAVTVHKSQGKTFDRVLIDKSGGFFAPGQMYVALSRCRNLDGIYLKQKISPKDIMSDQRVYDFLAEEDHS